MAELAGNFNFEIRLERSPGTSGDPQAIGDGGFQECTGLELEMEIKDIPEGGRNDGVSRRLGRAKATPLVLKRGMLIPSDGSAQIWKWIQDAVQGVRPVPRFDGVIRLKDHAQQRVVATWTFDRALPAKVTGPQLNAKTGEIAIEELTLAHEGLKMRIS